MSECESNTTLTEADIDRIAEAVQRRLQEADEGMVRLSEVIKLLGVGRTSVYQMIGKGQIPEPRSMRIGESTRYVNVWRRADILKARRRLVGGEKSGDPPCRPSGGRRGDHATA